MKYRRTWAAGRGSVVVASIAFADAGRATGTIAVLL
jgi:hypothetical protein